MSSSNKRARTGTSAARARRGGGAATRPNRSGGGAATTRNTAARTARTARPGDRRQGRATDGPALVVGAVAPTARVAGGLAVLSALCLLAAPAFPMVSAGGDDVGGAANVFDFVPALVAAGVLAAAGVLTARGRLPRLGLAVVAAFGAVSAGQLLQNLFLYQDGRTSRDLPLPVAMVRSFLYEPDTGLHLRVVAHALALLALLLVLWSWPRTWMEDDGSFDRLRPRFGAVSLFAGFVAATGVSIPAGDSDFPTLGPQSVIGRFGLDAWGTTVLAAVLLVAAVVAPSLRPRLAAVGMYVGLAAATAAQSMETVLLVTRSDGVHANLGTALPIVAAVAFAVLAVAAWRMSRGQVAEPDPA